MFENKFNENKIFNSQFKKKSKNKWKSPNTKGILKFYLRKFKS